MNRDYSTGTAEGIQFFIGIEVEHTPAYGKQTMFVTGIHSVEAINQRKEQFIQHSSGKFIPQHIYFGANQSFKDTADWPAWEKMITPFLREGMLCTLDIPVHEAENILETGLCEFHNFIPMISVKLPYISQFNYNTCVKIDDKDFNATNPGVWVHRLHDLMPTDKFTDWSKYKDDRII